MENNLVKGNKFLRLVLIISFTLAVNSLLFITASVPPTSAQEKPKELKFSWFEGATTPESFALERYARAVEKRAKGKVKIICYPGEQLATAAGTYDAVTRGISEIGHTCQSYTPGRFLLSQTLELPLGFTSSLMGSRICWEMIKKYCMDEYRGVKLLYVWTTPPTQIHTLKGKAVRKLEDSKGLEIRCPVGSSGVLKTLGFTPVVMPVTETYSALEKGIVHGTSLPYHTMMTWKFGEKTKYSTEANINITLFMVIMNQNIWESLSSDVKEAFVAESTPALNDVAKSWDAVCEEAVKWMVGLGNEIIKLPPEELARWEAHYFPVRDAWIKDLEAKGKFVKPMVEETLDHVKNYSKIYK